MSQKFRSNADIARQFRALAERRRDHFAELYRSGRWRHYYSEEVLVQQLRETVQTVETWDALANPQAAAEGPQAPAAETDKGSN